LIEPKTQIQGRSHALRSKPPRSLIWPGNSPRSCCGATLIVMSTGLESLATWLVASAVATMHPSSIDSIHPGLCALRVYDACCVNFEPVMAVTSDAASLLRPSLVWVTYRLIKEQYDLLLWWRCASCPQLLKRSQTDLAWHWTHGISSNELDKTRDCFCAPHSVYVAHAAMPS